MSFLTDIEATGGKIEEVLKEVVTFGKNAETVFVSLSGPVKAAMLAVFYDAVKAEAAGAAAVQDVQAGNIAGAVTQSETTASLVKAVVSDFKAGVSSVEADFKALNIKL